MVARTHAALPDTPVSTACRPGLLSVTGRWRYRVNVLLLWFTHRLGAGLWFDFVGIGGHRRTWGILGPRTYRRREHESERRIESSQGTMITRLSTKRAKPRLKRRHRPCR